MADELPQVVGTIEDGQSGAGYQTGDDLCIVAGPSSAGTAYLVRTFSRSGLLPASVGYGPMPDVAARVCDVDKKKVVAIKLPTATASVASAVDATLSPTGTSVLTLTGTPLGRFDLRVRVATGGTIGTAGCKIDVSLDGGRKWLRGIALGTAVTYAIANSGLTLNFAAGTLVATEEFSASTTEPMWDPDSLTAMFAALAETTVRARVLILTGTLESAADVEAVADAVEAYRTATGRPMRAIVTVRDWYPDVESGPLTLAWTAYAAGPPVVKGTVARPDGSFVTDGWKAGMKCSPDLGSDLHAGKTFTVDTVAALTLTFSEGDTEVALDAEDLSVTLTGTEPEVDWIAALGAEFDSVAKPRVCGAGGFGWVKSGLTGWYTRMPAGALIGAHYMKLDLQRSAARVKSGKIDGVTLHDSNGDLIEHDERVVGGLLAHRIACLRTFDSKGGVKQPPVYVALPVLMHAPGSDFSRLQLGCLMDKVEQVINDQLEDELEDDVELKTDGTMTATERARIMEAVNGRVDREVVRKKQASAVSWTMASDDVFTPDGGTVTGECTIRYRGYIERFETTYRFARPEQE